MLSCIVLTKNEEKNIETCLNRLGFCDEIIIIDDYSTDNTLQIANKYPVKVYQNKLNSNFSAQRNFGINKANGDWVLFIDADEQVDDLLTKNISKVVNQKKENKNMLFPQAYFLKRRDYFLGKWLKYGETGNIKFIRLAKKDNGKWSGKVHEIWDIDKKSVGELEGYLNHYPHRTIAALLNKINYYSDIKSLELINNNSKVHLWEIIVYPAGKFIFNYILKFGFLDGTAGFILAMMMSLHSFLVRGKTWLILNKRQS